jgi:hypothetical protein
MTLEMTGLDQFLKDLKALKQLPDKLIRVKLAYALPFLHKEITSKTPVWTGKALRNWIWTVGAPYGGGELPALGSGPPGPTNSMPLGAEPRRPANQAAADASFAQLNMKNPYQQFWLSNNASDIADLEYGKLPTPGTSRNSKGMVRVTLQNLLLSLEGGAK